MKEKHIVEIKAISKKTKGIKIQKDDKEVWVDVADNIDIEKIKKGKAEITIDLSKGKPIVTFIQHIQEKEEDYSKIRDKRITRLALINSSIEIFKLTNTYIETANKDTTDEVVRKIITIAKKLEKYVYE